MVGIYKITNPLTKKSYIGSSNNIGIRFTKHKSDLRLGKHHSSKLQNSYNKHGDMDISLYLIIIRKFIFILYTLVLPIVMVTLL